MGTGMMGHIGNVACPPSRATWGYDNGVHEQWGTWAMGHMSIRGRVMGIGVIGHIAIIMHRSRWGTGVTGHMGNGAHSGCIQ